MRIGFVAVRIVALSVLSVFSGTGCGDDSGGNPGSGGTAAPQSGTGGSGAGGMSGGTGGSGAGGMNAGMDGGTDAGAVLCGGRSCEGDERCVDGACRTACSGDADCPGESCCEGYCTDTEGDRDHCGACGDPCPTGRTCAEGECAMPMCSGEPGDVIPLDPDWDAGVAAADSGVDEADPPVFGNNGCAPNEVCADQGDGPVCLCGSEPGCPPDQYCEDGECRCGDAPGCDTAESCCEAGCVDTQSDEANCGFCGRACAEGHSCVEGECTCPEEGERLCHGECVDTQSDELNCGRCGRECAQGASCVAGSCQCDEAGEIACDGVCIDGESEQNCGACGVMCEEPATCRDPSGSRPLGCYCPNVNEVPCDGVCVSLGTAQHCSRCNDSCMAPSSVCRDSSCQCPIEGESACGDSCVDLSAGTDIDPGEDTLFENCGACGITCLQNATCDDGVCSCPSASTTDLYCDDDPTTGATDDVYECIEVTTTKNCGACGNACIDDSECRQSGDGADPQDYACVCIGDDSGKTHCAGAGCRTLDSDPGHCGACGNLCPEGIACESGECDCPGDASVQTCRVDGEPVCVDTDTDAANCGECGETCAAGEECCGGECIDPDSYADDRDNCGQCGAQCADFGCGFLGLGACACDEGECESG